MKLEVSELTIESRGLGLSLDKFIKSDEKDKKLIKKPKEAESSTKLSKRENKLPSKKEFVVKDEKKESFLKENHEYFFLSTEYDPNHNKTGIKLYDVENQTMVYFHDPYNYKPYFYVDIPEKDLNPKDVPASLIDHIEEVTKKDLLSYATKKFTKIVTKTPADVPRVRDNFEKTWESDIRFHLNWIYDNQLVPGRKYIWNSRNNFQESKSRKEGMKLPEEIIKNLEKFGDLISVFRDDFEHEIPNLPIVSLDIEVESTKGFIPQASNPKEKIICICLVSNTGLRKAYVLRREEIEIGEKPENYPDNIEIEFFTNEANLLKEVFKRLVTFSIIVTFNGDRFDFPYLHSRAKRLKVHSPINWNRRQERCDFKKSLHIDLYRFYHNVAIKTYAFGGRYQEENLDGVAEALLGEGKIKVPKQIHELSEYDLIYYCDRDTSLTLNLILFENNTPLNLIFILSRISRTPIDELIRSSVSNWVRNLFYFEHRRRNCIIPHKEEIEKMKGSKAHSKAIIRDKKYQGAIVIQPVPGIHFRVAVLDFASLYPSIISAYNLSYETIKCPHSTCRDNRVPETNYWVCKEQRGIMADIIGFIKDIRVLWLKPSSKGQSELRDFFKIFERSLKVLINASYGVFGSSNFQLYCIAVAESTTAFGRNSINKTVEKSESMGIKVLYGDTDSVFLLHPSEDQIDEIIRWSHEVLNVGLEMEKEYRYCILSERKKNYLGVYHDSNVDIKGLMGKKRNTPPFLQKEFKRVIKILSGVMTREEFDLAKERIETTIKAIYSKLESRSYPIQDLSIKVQITKPLAKYKVKPPHVRAAEMLIKYNHPVSVGQLILYIKTREKDGIIPLELYNEQIRIDIKYYKGQVSSIFGQLLDTIGISAKELETGQVNLLKFFG